MSVSLKQQFLFPHLLYKLKKTGFNSIPLYFFNFFKCSALKVILKIVLLAVFRNATFLRNWYNPDAIKLIFFLQKKATKNFELTFAKS